MLAFIGTLRLGCVINFSWPLRCLLAVGAFLSAPARMWRMGSLWMLEYCLRDADSAPYAAVANRLPFELTRYRLEECCVIRWSQGADGVSDGKELRLG